MKLKLKLDKDGHVVLAENKVVYMDEDADNKEYPLDPPSMYNKITDLGKENKLHRDKVTAGEAKYLAFAEIEDIDVWKKDADKAIETVANYKDKDFMEASKVEKLKDGIKTAYEDQLTAKDDKAKVVAKANADVLSSKDLQIRTLMVSNKFSVSPHFTGDDSITTMPPDAAEALFGSHYKVEEVDGKLGLKAYDVKGEEILSKANPGETASFEESISIILDGYPNRDYVLRASEGGSGGLGGHGPAGAKKEDELAKLQKQLEQAQKDKNMTASVALRNRIHKLQAGQKT